MKDCREGIKMVNYSISRPISPKQLDEIRNSKDRAERERRAGDYFSLCNGIKDTINGRFLYTVGLVDNIQKAGEPSRVSEKVVKYLHLVATVALKPFDLKNGPEVNKRLTVLRDLGYNTGRFEEKSLKQRAEHLGSINEDVARQLVRLKVSSREKQAERERRLGRAERLVSFRPVMGSIS